MIEDYLADAEHLNNLGESLLGIDPSGMQTQPAAVQIDTSLPDEFDAQPDLGAFDEPDVAPQQQMSDQELMAIIHQKINSSHQWYGTGALASQRIEADKYYRGEPRGDEMEGRSQVVSRDVAESVDGMMPSLLRVFAGGDQVVIMEPSRQDAEDDAAQATDYINWLFLQQNEGFQVLYTWFKDALLKRNGIVMAYHENRICREKSNYSGLTEQQFAILKNDPCYTILKQSSYPDPYAPKMPPQIDPQTGQPLPMPPPPMLFDCTIMSAKPVKKIIIENVPPDEFIIETRAASIDAASFLGRRRKTAVSDLIELGFDPEILRNLPRGETFDYSQEKLERHRDENNMMVGTEGESSDWTMRKVWVTEVYIRVDYDGDGVAEWRKVTIGGDGGSNDTILLNEETDDHPFSSLTPYPDPHRFYGYGIYDQVKDIQDIKTALLRGSLDSIYLANNPRIGMVEGQVNVDDLLDSRVGGIVRMKNPNALVPVPTVMASPQAAQMIEYMDMMRYSRTGTSQAAAGLDPNILNSSATGANILNNNQQQRLEMIARIFAETGVKRLFRRIFQLICQHGDKNQTVRLRGKWVDINPTAWAGRMDVTVSVGIGLGDKQQQMAQAMALLNLDERIVQLQGGVQGPLLTVKNVYNKLAKIVEAAGWKSVEPYYTDPDTIPPQPPKPPSPEIQLEQMRLQIEQMKLEKMRENESADAQQSILDAQVKMEIAKLESETRIAVAQISASAALEGKQLQKSADDRLQQQYGETTP